MAPGRRGAKGLERSVKIATPLDRDSPEPLHRQLAAALEHAIRSGALAPGDRLESESELAARYGVSRITLRQAVGTLVDRQLLVRRQGKGTFVTTPTVRHDLKRLHGLLGSLFSQADGASTQLMRYELRRPASDVAAALGLAPRGKALLLERRYLIHDTPVAFTQAWLAAAVAAVPRMKAELLSTEDMIREAGLRIAATEVSIRADTAGARIGRLLKVSAQAPVLVFGRHAHAIDGRAKEVGRIWFRADRYQFVCSTTGSTSSADLFDIQDVSEKA
jgi:GntR family transcriptional regulator